MHSFFSKLKLANRPYSNQLNTELLPYDVSATQWGLIRFLAEIGPATFSDIAVYWQVEKPSITPIAQKLVDQKIIYISPGKDKRKKLMHLTEKGLAMFEQMKPAIELFQEELLEGITQEERDVADRLLEKLLVNLRKRG